MKGMCRMSWDQRCLSDRYVAQCRWPGQVVDYAEQREVMINDRLTSSSTPESTPPSVNRSSHVLITRGADDGSARLTPVTLR